jgi:beta-mannosidase
MKFPLHRHFSLDGSWILAFADKSARYTTMAELESSDARCIPATVPGNVEIDLQAVGILDDPFVGMNAVQLRAWETKHFWYGRKFNVSPESGFDAFLRFEGLDCYAEIFLNGEKIGEGDNALIEHEFAVNDVLREGENEIVIHLRPAVVEAKKYDYPPGLGANRANYESLHVRKSPHAYGWDIMPRAVSAGLWRSVFLVLRPIERIEHLLLRSMVAGEDAATLMFHYRARLAGADPRYQSYEIEIEGSCGESRFIHREKVLFEAGVVKAIKVPQPHLWWPRGRGEQNLYAVTVRLLKDGREIDRALWRHGIRTVGLERTSRTDASGRGEFVFRVNGEKVFLLGTNWVPADAFHSRDLARTPQMLGLAEEIGCNALRCWGGNVYESDLFFDLCDEKGFLVWQDFALGCAVYPQDEEFQKRFGEEATRVVRRLREHASLLLWAGDNECDWAYEWYGLGNPNANVLTRKVLPDVLRMEDPGRPYLPSSPFIDEAAYAANDHSQPEHHLWGPRDYAKGDFYRNPLCHFASEVGYHGCPSPASIRRFLSADKLWPPGNDEWILHSTSPVPGVDIADYRTDLMTRQIYEFFGVMPGNLDDYSLWSQFVQAEALKFFIELFRVGKWRRTGIIWWNLCDGWPQFSDAVVDYYFEKKVAFDVIRRVQQPLVLVVKEPLDWRHEIVACNDLRHDLTVSYSIRDLASNEVLSSGTKRVLADAVTLIDSIPARTAEKKFLLIEWESQDGRGRNHYLAGSPPFDPVVYQAWFQAAFSSS